MHSTRKTYTIYDFLNGCYWLHIALPTIISLLVEILHIHLFMNIFFNETYLWQRQRRAGQLLHYIITQTLRIKILI